MSVNLLSKVLDNFNHLINELKLEFVILGISESRILKSQSLNNNVMSVHKFMSLNKPPLNNILKIKFHTKLALTSTFIN